ncbi:MAG: hypothetical protein JWO31_2159, partial [Phycisphaerales bacterium]|nr:hypothetical protein [Phycisphaerales bacterium]
EKLVAAMSNARDSGMVEVSPARIATTYFTDNIACAIPVKNHASMDYAVTMMPFMAARYQAALALGGVLSRGAISCGLHFADDRTAFGPAIVEAVKLEKETGFPRVALSDEVVELAKVLSARQYKLHGGPFARNLLVDEDGTTFVNTLQCLNEECDASERTENVSRHRSIVQALLDSDEAATPSIRKKYDWLGAYHNWYCTNGGAHRSDLTVPGIGVNRSFSGFPG